ncbi:hypothetical protein CgunFtcFv8_018906 [Champsocephalus gunnari]|uniref:Uncharacterized protein n=1 Tax=Champsocephalus gunnari TaxID=52237 RepID=A0AAN8HN79_CHAGU|nr:hypothetical protein CgunFtcFv8_018906 [Champsocephalus gunnari]
MAQGTAVRLPTSPADSSVPGPSAGRAAVSDPDSPGTHGSFLVSMPTAYAVRQAVGDSVAVEGAICSHPVIGQPLWAWPLSGNT